MIKPCPFNILQITDTHLFESNDEEMFGVKTNERLKKLIDHVLALDLKIDKVFLTGDVSQDMTPESYQYADTQISRFKRAAIWIPGNHDDFKIMLAEFNKSHYLQPAATLKMARWTFIFLNTKYKDLDTGYFHEKDKALIEDTMRITDERENVCVVMHHHPIKTNTPLIDNYILENTDSFWRTINKHPQIKNIICGHVHGDYTIKRDNVTLHAAMASCLQWVKGTEKMAVDKSIGCKLYQFFEDDIKTQTIQLEADACSNE